jgi:hypothetical protein
VTAATPEHGDGEMAESEIARLVKAASEGSGLRITPDDEALAELTARTPAGAEMGAYTDKEIAAVYRERARLIAFLAACYPSVLVHGADPETGDWPVIFVDTPAGQLTWHLAEGDLDLFAHVRALHVAESGGEPKWDGHTTEEKHERLAELIPHAMDARDEPKSAPEQAADLDTPEPLIVSEDPVLNGPRLSWYASMSKAEYHHDTLTASRDGVLPDGNTYLHQIPSSWLSAAVRAHGLLKEGKAGEALAMATHERLDGRIVEVAR